LRRRLGAGAAATACALLVGCGHLFDKGSLVIEPGAAVRFNAPPGGGVLASLVTNDGMLELAGGPQILSGELRGRGTLRILAPAEVTLAAANPFSGPIFIGQGATLRVSGSLGCGRYASPLHNNGLLVLAGPLQAIGGPLTGSGELRLEGAELVLGIAGPAVDPHARCRGSASSGIGENPFYPAR
jgi:hypothetical protein